MSEKVDRREFVNRTLAGSAVAAAYSLEEKILLAAAPASGAQGKPLKPDIAPGSMPCGKIGKVDISRLFLGGNLIGGWAHSRDLLYVSKLFKAYNTEQKIFETLELAEQCGVNTILIDPRDWEPVLKYNRERKRNFQSLVCTLPDVEKAKMADHIKQIVDKGAHLIYIHGLVADGRTMTGHNDELGHIIDLIKSHGVPAGIGGHSLETVIASEKNKLNPDFYVKTFHMDRYWSATVPEKREEWCWYKPMSSDPGRYHDNMFCLDPAKAAAFMESVAKPWIAFKTMAAGAIHPQMAFSHSYRHGADFIVAGMFDFQLEQDVKLAIAAIRKSEQRKRPWHG